MCLKRCPWLPAPPSRPQRSEPNAQSARGASRQHYRCPLVTMAAVALAAARQRQRPAGSACGSGQLQRRQQSSAVVWGFLQQGAGAPTGTCTREWRTSDAWHMRNAAQAEGRELLSAATIIGGVNERCGISAAAVRMPRALPLPPLLSVCAGHSSLSILHGMRGVTISRAGWDASRGCVALALARSPFLLAWSATASAGWCVECLLTTVTCVCSLSEL